jgi:hypothetical protein
MYVDSDEMSFLAGVAGRFATFCHRHSGGLECLSARRGIRRWFSRAGLSDDGSCSFRDLFND